MRTATLAAALSLALAAPAAAAERAATHPEWAAHFRAERVSPADGAMVVYDEAGATWHRFAPKACATRHLPASTFKIFNTMAGHEAGVYRDETYFQRWDGQRRMIQAWNQDLDLAKAFRFSAVWFFQTIAREVGERRMAAYLKREGYGNADLRGGLDRFWLDGKLAISPDEQVAFLRRLRHERLGFPVAGQRLVKRLMENNKTARGTVYGKTGWVQRDAPGPEVGWWVGFVETKAGAHYFALKIATEDPHLDLGPVRKRVANRILGTFGLPAAE